MLTSNEQFKASLVCLVECQTDSASFQICEREFRNWCIFPFKNSHSRSNVHGTVVSQPCGSGLGLMYTHAILSVFAMIPLGEISLLALFLNLATGITTNVFYLARNQSKNWQLFILFLHLRMVQLLSVRLSKSWYRQNTVRTGRKSRKTGLCGMVKVTFRYLEVEVLKELLHLPKKIS